MYRNNESQHNNDFIMVLCLKGVSYDPEKPKTFFSKDSLKLLQQIKTTTLCGTELKIRKEVLELSDSALQQLQKNLEHQTSSLLSRKKQVLEMETLKDARQELAKDTENLRAILKAAE